MDTKLNEEKELKISPNGEEVGEEVKEGQSTEEVSYVNPLQYPFMKVTEQLDVVVRHSPEDGFSASKESISIKMFAEEIKKARKKYIEDHYNPKVTKLLEMVDAWNMRNNPVYAQKKGEMNDKKEAPKPKERLEKLEEDLNSLKELVKILIKKEQK